MRRTNVVLFVALALVLAALPVMAQGGGTMSTAFAVQNLNPDPLAIANVVVEFRTTAGGPPIKTINQPIAGNRNFNFDQRQPSGDPGQTPFQGSAIVSANEPIGGAANIMRTGGTVPSYESYNALGASNIGLEVILPQVLKNVSSGGSTWNTTIAIQNTDTSNVANVSLVFSPDPVVNPAIGGTLTVPFTQTLTIAAGGSAYLDQANTPAAADIGAKFFGSVRVLSNVAVAPLVYSDGSGSVLLAYPSYVSGTTDVIALPSIYKRIVSQGDEYNTAILIVNFGSVPAVVGVQYVAVGTGAVSGMDTITVPAKASKNVDQRYDAPSITSLTFLGGAAISSLNGQPIAAMVNLRGGRYGMTYGGISGGGTTAYLPIAYKTISSAGYSWSSTVIVSNFDALTGPASVNFTFYPSGSTAEIVDPVSYAVPVLQQFDLRYTTSIASDPSFIGAVKISSGGATPRKIGVMVQTRGAGGSGDALMGFLGLMP